MRIITGSAKGHKIKVPKGKEIRPAQDKVRQAVFSVLYGLAEGAHVLDLFAGSGSYGLEAFSRGAGSATFVDIDKECVWTIKENLRALDFESRGEAIKEDAQRFVDFIKNSSERFDLIFLDPPYEMGAQIHLLKSLSAILAPQGVVIFSHARETKIPKEVDSLKVIRERTYSATTVSFLAKTNL